MKKKIFVIVCLTLCTVLLAACQCQHDWVDANCTTAKTCARCKEVVGEPLGHSWIGATCMAGKTCSACGRVEGAAIGHSWCNATCTTAKTCSVCGETEGTALGHNWLDATCTRPTVCLNCGETSGTELGHRWIGAVNRSGIEGRICEVCEELEMGAYSWIPLTECEQILVSNEDAHKNDLVVGNWQTRAGKLPDSIRFCVSNKESYKNTHYCVYKLNGNFDWLSGLISFSDKSEKFATAKIQIYLDNELAYESSEISEITNDVSFTLNVEEVDLVRVVCSTTDMPSAYCVLSASVY